MLQRIQEEGSERQTAPLVRIERNTRPIAAEETDIFHNTIDIALARNREENGLSAGFIFQDGTEMIAFIESGYVKFGRITRIIATLSETCESTIGRKAEPRRARIVNTFFNRLESGRGDIIATILIALGVPKVIVSIVRSIDCIESLWVLDGIYNLCIGLVSTAA